MRMLTQKDGDLSLCFDKIVESRGRIVDTTLKHLLINNHTNDDNKGKMQGQLLLEHIFDFRKTYNKLPKSFGFELQKNIKMKTKFIVHYNRW